MLLSMIWDWVVDGGYVYDFIIRGGNPTGHKLG